MIVQLTPQQLQVLSPQTGQLPRLIDPRDNTAYVLLPEAEYEAVREIIQDERQQRAIREMALRNAAGRMDESP